MGKLPKRPLAELRAPALDLAERLRPSCERIEIAGSIRREAPEVGDIELVAIPRLEDRTIETQNDLFGPRRAASRGRMNLLWEAVDALGVTCTKRGPVYRQFTWQGVRVDVFTCERGNWGWILFHRTGPGYLRRKIGSMLVEQGYAAADGWIWDRREHKLTIDRVDTPEEEDVFRLLGVAFIPPSQRDRLKEA